MLKATSLALAGLLVLCGSEPGFVQLEPDLVERGKKATALVEVSGAQGDATASAFCVDPSGLFVTNAHVIAGAAGRNSRIRLVVDSGLATQRILPAKVLRRDDEIDLALLQVASVPGLTALALGQDADLHELAEVTTFGYPFGHLPAAGRTRYP
jgi:S1-C subfamily serine protease